MSEAFAEALDKVRKHRGEWASEANICQLTHPSPEDLEAFRKTWFDLDDNTRYQVAARLTDLAEQDSALAFEELFQVLLDDDLAAVRVFAIARLSDIIDMSLARRMLWLVKNDADAGVRAEAATALGAYLFASDGESEREQSFRREVEDVLLEIVNTDAEDMQVRQRALESYGYASDPFADDVLREAYESDEDDLRASAVFAMGRRADEAWLPIVHRELRSEPEVMRLAAIYAAGVIGSSSSIPHLLRVIGEDANDDVRAAAVYALADIDSPEAVRILEDLLESDDITIVNAADEALDIRLAAENEDLVVFDYGFLDEPGISDVSSSGSNGNQDDK